MSVLLLISAGMIIPLGHTLIQPSHRRQVRWVIIYAALAMLAAVVAYIADPNSVSWLILNAGGYGTLVAMVLIEKLVINKQR